MIRTIRLRVYGGPTAGAVEMAATYEAVTAYKIKLAQIYRLYRKLWRDLRTENFPAFAAAEASYEQAKKALKELEDDVKSVRARMRKGWCAPPAVAEARAKKKAAAE